MKLVNQTLSEVTWICSGGVHDTGSLKPGQSVHLNAPRDVQTQVQFIPNSGGVQTFAEGDDIVTFALTVTRGADESGSLAAAADAGS